MSNKKLKVNFPKTQGAVPPYMSNVKIQLAPLPLGADLAVKYGLDPLKVTKMGSLATDIPAEMAQAATLRAQAESITESYQKKIREANLLNHEFGDAMQKHTAFITEDFELMGYLSESAPANPLEAKVKVTHITNTDTLIRFDWAKESWHGIRIYGSYDDVKYTFLDKDDRSPWEDRRFNQKYGVPENRYFIFRHVDNAGKEIGVDTKVVVVAAIYDIEGSRGVAN
jgi:hypothetical protein